MNTSKIYSEATTPQAIKDSHEAEQAKEQEDKTFIGGLAGQHREEWLDHPYTTIFLQNLLKLAKDKMDEVVDSSDNLVIGPQEKLNKLIVVKTLNQIVNYARTGKYN